MHGHPRQTRDTGSLHPDGVHQGMTRTICILGGTGFVGRHIANRLALRDWQMRIPTRRRERHRSLLVLPTVELIDADIRNLDTLKELFAGCDTVINLVGILNEPRNNSNAFRDMHVELPRRVVQACLATGTRRLLHMSALNAYPREERSQYLRTKGEGEDLVHAAATQGLQVTSFRPSVIFGHDDSFFNRFAGLLKLSPFVFPLACPDTRFAPVYVGDVADAYAGAIDARATIGQHLDLCGPHTYTLKELVEYTAHLIGVRRRVIGLNRRMSMLQARVLGHFPGKPFSLDNFWSLQKDSVCHTEFPKVFGIRPTSVEAVVPQYLANGNERARYPRMRAAGHKDT